MGSFRGMLLERKFVAFGVQGPCSGLRNFLMTEGKSGRRAAALQNVYLPAQRLKISAALVPPKPKEFESA